MATLRPSTRAWRSMLQQYVSGRPLHDLARRTFASSSPRNSRSLPRFEPSSSDDLDALLSLVRSRILVTGLLNPQQQELVFHQKWRSTLENEPVYATVGGEEIQLQHLDRFRDMPNRWDSWNRAIDLARTDGDWRNMVRMLQGYKAITKGKGIDSGRLEKWVRKAREHGQIGKVFQCLQSVHNTGVTLADHGVAHQVFVGCLSEEMRHKQYTKSVVKLACTRMKTLLQLLEMPEHCGGRKLAVDDVRQQPWVLGVVVEVAALYQKMRWPEGYGPQDELVKYVGRFLDCVKKTPLNTLLLDVPDSTSTGMMLGKYAEIIAKLLPVWHGLDLAEGILDSDSAQTAEIAKVKQSAASLIEQLVADIESNKHPDKEYPSVQVWKEYKKPQNASSDTNQSQPGISETS